MLSSLDTHQDVIVFLSSGKVATEEIKKNLLAALEKGENAVYGLCTKAVITVSQHICSHQNAKTEDLQ